MRLPGKFAPWGRWEVMEDGRVMLSFRCACSPGEVHTMYLPVNENGSSAEARCPRCKNILVQVRSSREIVAEGGAPGSAKKGG